LTRQGGKVPVAGIRITFTPGGSGCTPIIASSTTGSDGTATVAFMCSRSPTPSFVVTGDGLSVNAANGN
jgi:hypothetical protein